jgi:Co/Zn/Cd efflux system component
VRLRAGHRLQSPALVADGKHARVDGFVSLGVVASALVVGLGVQIADPIIGLVITLVILRITWESWTRSGPRRTKSLRTTRWLSARSFAARAMSKASSTEISFDLVETVG